MPNNVDAPFQERGVIYARFSSSGQREESIEGQLRECRAFAERHNINIVGEYCDYALTGTSDKRPQFQKMIKDSSKGQFSVVITWKNDRFARSRYDSATYKFKLKQNGVKVLYAKESIPEGPEGIILESVMEGYAEYYSANLSQNVKRGMYDSALKLQTLGQVVYGLQKAADGTWEQNPAQAPIVRRIFDEYLAGKPAKNIYTDLNEEGFRTVRGGLFNKGAINRILRNEKYYGLYRYEDIVVENGIPPIISKETFEKTQKIVDMHHRKPAAKKIDNGFLLTGKLFCGHCDELMTGDGGTSKTGKVYSYYICNNRRKKKCTKERVSKDLIEDFIVQKLAEIANDDDVINEFADRFMEWQEKQQSSSPTVGMEDRLRKIDAALKNSMAVIDSGFITESLKKHITELEEERIQVERGIAKEKLKSVKLERKQVIYFLQKFRNGDINDVAWRIYLVDTFLQAAYLFDDGRVLLHLNYSGNNNKVSVKIAEKVVNEGEELCSNFAPFSAPRQSKLYIACSDFFKIRVHLCRCSSFFVKSHARLTCSFVNALTTVYCRYQLFTSFAHFVCLNILILLCFTKNPIRLSA